MVFGGLPNQTAAMPSLHTGFTYLIAFYAITRLHSRVAMAGAALPGRHVTDARSTPPSTT